MTMGMGIRRIREIFVGTIYTLIVLVRVRGMRMRRIRAIFVGTNRTMFVAVRVRGLYLNGVVFFESSCGSIYIVPMIIDDTSLDNSLPSCNSKDGGNC